MKKVNTNGTLKADRIYLKGCMEPLEDREIMILDGFLVVSGRADNDPVTWYNMDTVSRIEGVKPSGSQPKAPRATWL